MAAIPCHELIPQPDSRTNVFHNLMFHMSQCLQCIPYNDFDAAGTLRLVRWRDPNGNIHIGYVKKKATLLHKGYFRYTEEIHITPPFTGCEMAIIAENCSVAWLKFTIGEPVPSRAAKGGYMTGHGPVFVTRYKHPIKGSYRFGYYMTGNPFLKHIDEDRHDINTFDILIIV